MYKTFTEYESYVSELSRKKHDVDKHHVLAISSFGPNIKENIVDLLTTDHKKVHQVLDVAYRYFATLIRRQRMKEN